LLMFKPSWSRWHGECFASQQACGGRKVDED